MTVRRIIRLRNTTDAVSIAYERGKAEGIEEGKAQANTELNKERATSSALRIKIAGYRTQVQQLRDQTPNPESALEIEDEDDEAIHVLTEAEAAGMSAEEIGRLAERDDWVLGSYAIRLELAIRNQNDPVLHQRISKSYVHLRAMAEKEQEVALRGTPSTASAAGFRALRAAAEGRPPHTMRPICKLHSAGFVNTAEYCRLRLLIQNTRNEELRGLLARLDLAYEGEDGRQPIRDHNSVADLVRSMRTGGPAQRQETSVAEEESRDDVFGSDFWNIPSGVQESPEEEGEEETHAHSLRAQVDLALEAMRNRPRQRRRRSN